MPLISPHGNWDGTAGSGWDGGAEAVPVDPVRTGEKAILQRLIPFVPETIVADFDLCFDSFAAFATTLLDGAIDDSVTTFTVDSTAKLPTAGRGAVDIEVFTWTSKTATTLTGITRGVGASDNVMHADDAKVMFVDETGIEKITVYAEGNKVDVTAVAIPTTINDTQGSGATYPCWFATLDSSAFGDGAVQVYVESTPSHPDIQKRVIGPFTIWHDKNGTLVNSGVIKYCAGTGDDITGDGTSPTPYRTINRVLTADFSSNADASGVEIRCKDGSYSMDLTGDGNNHADGRPIIVTRDSGSAREDVKFDVATADETKAAHVVFKDVRINHTAGRVYHARNGANELTFDDLKCAADALVNPSPWTRIFTANPNNDGLTFNVLNSEVEHFGYWGKADHVPKKLLYRGSWFHSWNADVQKSNFRDWWWSNVRMHFGRTPSDGTHSDVIQIATGKFFENCGMCNVRIWDFNHQGGWSADTSIMIDSAFVNVLFGYLQTAQHQLVLGDKIDHVIFRNFASNNRFIHGDLLAQGSTLNDRINCHYWKVRGNNANITTAFNSHSNNFHEDTTRAGDDPNATAIDQANFWANMGAFDFTEGSGTPKGITCQKWDVLGNTRDPEMTSVGPWKGDSEGSSADTTDPTAPTSPAAVNVSTTENTCSWTQGTDNVAMDGTEVHASFTMGFTPDATTLVQLVAHPTATFSHVNLVPNKIYYYQYRSKDVAGNFSGFAAEVSAATPTPPAVHGPLRVKKVVGGGFRIYETKDPT